MHTQENKLGVCELNHKSALFVSAKLFIYGIFLLLFSTNTNSQVTLQSQVKIADNGLYFDGLYLDYSSVGDADTGEKYDFFFGRSISAHGDSIKKFKHYVFMTWYRGGKDDRHVILTRLNTQTGSVVNIEFPHQHSGFRGNPLIGESHNTIGLAISPINATIHMVYDMHAYDDTNHGGKFKDDFFRYSFSIAGAADLPDEQFTLDKFVKDTSEVNQGPNDYKHLTMTGDIADKNSFARLTYPKFFNTSDGTLLLYMRLGGNNNGAYLFNRYNAESQTWSKFTKFNLTNQRNEGNVYNWGLYGNMKYLNGKLRVGFQQRSSDNNDKYKYQNGVFYAYSDHPDGFGQWFNHKNEAMTWPLVNSDEIKVFEPGDYISHEHTNSVYIVKDFDWTVTERGDIHIISLVQTNTSTADATEFGFSGIPREKVYIHAYKPAGASDFIIDTEFVGATSIYTSGDNIYIIGLSNGKPYVEMAQGGTNTFSRVYEQTNGPTFAHGTIHIDEGKVYYYLMEKGEGNALPLYLQIIDLDIQTLKLAFEQSDITLTEGYNSFSLSVDASTTIQSRTIDYVELYINDNLIRRDSLAPFEWGNSDEFNEELLNYSVGSHETKAIAVDSHGSSLEIRSGFTVQEAILAPLVHFNGGALSMEEGYSEFIIEVAATTPMSSRSIEHVTLFVNNTEIAKRFAAPFQWDNTLTGLSSMPVGTHILKAVATDSLNLQSVATSQIVITTKTPVATATQPIAQEQGTSSGGGGSTTPLLILVIGIFAFLRRIVGSITFHNAL